METILKSDVQKSIKLGEIEVFTADQIKQFAEENYNEINKSTGSKTELMAQVATEIKSFKPFKVVDDQLNYEILFIRKAQIAWDPPTDIISKSRTGTYLNTPENRKLGRVGRRYGEKKDKIDLSDKTTSELEHIASNPNHSLSMHAREELNSRNKKEGLEPRYEKEKVDTDQLKREKESYVNEKSITDPKERAKYKEAVATMGLSDEFLSKHPGSMSKEEAKKILEKYKKG